MTPYPPQTNVIKRNIFLAFNIVGFTRCADEIQYVVFHEFGLVCHLVSMH